MEILQEEVRLEFKLVINIWTVFIARLIKLDFKGIFRQCRKSEEIKQERRGELGRREKKCQTLEQCKH